MMAKWQGFVLTLDEFAKTRQRRGIMGRPFSLTLAGKSYRCTGGIEVVGTLFHRAPKVVVLMEVAGTDAVDSQPGASS